MAEKQIKITLTKSTIGQRPNQKATVKALGLGRINSSVTKTVSGPIMGMVKTVAHLVEVEDIQ